MFRSVDGRVGLSVAKEDRNPDTGGVDCQPGQIKDSPRFSDQFFFFRREPVRPHPLNLWDHIEGDLSRKGLRLTCWFHIQQVRSLRCQRSDPAAAGARHSLVGCDVHSYDLGRAVQWGEHHDELGS